MNTILHPRYITDETGKRISVVLPIDEYESITERLEDMEDLSEAREAVKRVDQGEATIPWADIKAEHGLYCRIHFRGKTPVRQAATHCQASLGWERRTIEGESASTRRKEALGWRKALPAAVR